MKAELLAEHAARSAQAAAQMRALAAVPAAASTTAPLRLAKRTSNLFRDRAAPRRRLDLSAFGHVLAIDREAMQFDAEGLVSYEDLVAATLPQGCMPAVVPQLKTITVGGAVAGVGIEATSFRHGLVHDTLTEIEVLLPDGQIVTASASNAHRDLFFGFPNSYGTLGYALRVRARLLPVKPYVQVRHLRHSNPAAFIADLTAHCAGDADFVDGVVFGPREQVVSPASSTRRRPGHRSATTRSSTSTTARCAVATRTSSAPPVTCGAGTPTGSGARRTSARSTRCCGGCTGAAGWGRAPTPA